MDATIRKQMTDIQQYLIHRSNAINVQNAIMPQDFFMLGGEKIIERMQNTVLISSVYTNMLDQIDRMFDNAVPSNEYSVVVLLAYAIGQLITIRAYNPHYTDGIPMPSTQGAQDEVMLLIDYLTQYTGRDILPRF